MNQVRRLLLALGLVLASGAAQAACPVIPYVFPANSINPLQVNANFTSVRDCIVNASGFVQVNSSAALRALAAGVQPIVYRGYNVNPGDGMGVYYWSPSSTCADDSVSCIKPASNPASGRWLYSPLIAPNLPVSGLVAGFYYTQQTSLQQTIGTAGVPSTSPAALMAFNKYFDTSVASYPPGSPWQHPTLYSVCHLQAVGADVNNNACRGMMAEGIDNVGGSGTFVEGVKGVGVSTSTSGVGGGAYGMVAWGQSYNAQFTVGSEAQTVRTNGSDAPGPESFNPSAQLMVGFLYSNGVGGGQNRSDAGFMVNPFNPSKTSMGFACGQDTVEATAGACFIDFGGGALGLDLAVQGATHTLGAMLISNTDPILFRDAAGTGVVNAMYVGGDNALHLGSTTTSVNAEHDVLVGGNFEMVAGTITGNLVILKSVVAPAGTPLAGQFYLYMDAADSTLKAKGPSGSVTPLAVP